MSPRRARRPANAPSKSHKRLRLVKAVVQPHFVLDDGVTLREIVYDAVAVPADALAGFPERFEQDRVALEQRYNEAPDVTVAHASTPED